MKPPQVLYPLAGAVLVLAGCVNPYTTRLPTLATGPPQIERRLHERHDPFPLPEEGPGAEVRPPGFANPRALPRRVEEERILQGLTPAPVTPLPQVPSSRQQYPGTVRQ